MAGFGARRSVPLGHDLAWFADRHAGAHIDPLLNRTTSTCGAAPITPLGPHSTTVASCGHDETIARHRRNWDRAELLSMESNRACLKANPFGRLTLS